MNQAGRITLVVDGLPIVHIADYSADVRTNRELVLGMKPTNTPIGMVEGVEEYSITIEAYIPLGSPEPDWINIRDGILMITETGLGGATTLYTGCFCTREGKRYQEKGAAKRSIEMQATGRIHSPAVTP